MLNYNNMENLLHEDGLSYGEYVAKAKKIKCKIVSAKLSENNLSVEILMPNNDIYTENVTLLNNFTDTVKWLDNKNAESYAMVTIKLIKKEYNKDYSKTKIAVKTIYINKKSFI